MTPDELKSLQTPVKNEYRENPEAARRTMVVSGTVNQSNLTCGIEGSGGAVNAGLHPAAGGSGEWACSGDMLLESLVACAGVTLSAVATAMSIPLDNATVTAEGVMDFRGTLGVSKETPIGFESIRLNFDVQSSASEEQITKLVQLTERYCVIMQTLKNPPAIESSVNSK